MKKEIIAVGNYITIKKIAEAERRVGRVYVPSSQQSLLTKGEVITIGDGEKIKKLNLKVGDIVFYNEVENNTFGSSESNAVFFIRHDFIYGKEAKKK